MSQLLSSTAIVFYFLMCGQVCGKESSRRKDSVGSKNHHETTELLVGRRNHECFMKDEEEAVFFGGRFASTMEFYNIKDNSRVLSKKYGLLEVNHISYSAIEGLNGERQLWIPCGFKGSEVDKEEAVENMIILSKVNDSWIPSLGPKLQHKCGGCVSWALHLDGPNKPAYICKFGGSIGSHDKGEYITISECYDRINKTWVSLPKMLVPGDHMNGAYIPKNTCPPTNSRSSSNNDLINTTRMDGNDPMMLLFNLRTSSYGPTSRAVYALTLSPNKNGSITFPGDHGRNVWNVYSTDRTIMTLTSAAFLQSADKRFILSIGGINNQHHRYVDPSYYKIFIKSYDLLTRISVFNVCKKKWILSKIHLTIPRLAVAACRDPNIGSNISLVCGGTHFLDKEGMPKTKSWLKVNQNLRSCELVHIEDVISNLDNDFRDPSYWLDL